MECERMDCYETVWNGFRRLNFRFENRVAVLIFPKAKDVFYVRIALDAAVPAVIVRFAVVSALSK